MEFLGVGPTEFILIVVIALIVLGPKDLAKAGSTIGRWLNNLVKSDTWKVMQSTTKQLRNLPTQLMREDNLKNFLTPEDLQKQAAERKRDIASAPPRAISSNPPPPNPAPVSSTENVIHPPRPVDAPPAKTAKPAPKKPASKKSPAVKKTKAKPATKSTSRKKSDA